MLAGTLIEVASLLMPAVGVAGSTSAEQNAARVHALRARELPRSAHRSMMQRTTEFLRVSSPAWTMVALLLIGGCVTGFGASSRGGRGGKIIWVTTTEDGIDAPGVSLRAALADPAPRIVRFRVSGTINLTKPIEVTSGRLTIAGETAPAPGITIAGYGLRFHDVSDIKLRHLRVRIGMGIPDDEKVDALGFRGDPGTVRRVVVDHCSLMWGIDENLDTWNDVEDVTIQWSILAEGRLPHSKAWLSGKNKDLPSDKGPGRITLHHSLLAHNDSRNPQLAGGVYDIVNNVIYNWSAGGTILRDGAQVNLINNYYRAGPDLISSDMRVHLSRKVATGPYPQVYMVGNVIDLPDDLEPHALDPKKSILAEDYPPGTSASSATRFPAPAVATQAAATAYEKVLSSAGPRYRDEEDQRIIEEVRRRQGRVGRRSEASDAW